MAAVLILGGVLETRGELNGLPMRTSGPITANRRALSLPGTTPGQIGRALHDKLGFVLRRQNRVPEALGASRTIESGSKLLRGPYQSAHALVDRGPYLRSAGAVTYSSPREGSCSFLIFPNRSLR